MEYAIVMAGEDIYHHGIKGQKWGVRRYQNKDGSLTAAGKKRYGVNTYEKDGKTYKQGNAKYYNPDGTINKKGLKYFKSDERGALTDAGRKEYGLPKDRKDYSLPEKMSKRDAKRIIKAEGRYWENARYAPEEPDLRPDVTANDQVRRAEKILERTLAGEDYIKKQYYGNQKTFTDKYGNEVKQLSYTTRGHIEQDKAYVSSKAYQDMMRQDLDKKVEKYGEAAVKKLMETYSFYETPTYINVASKARKERKANDVTEHEIAKQTKQLDIDDFVKNGKIDISAGYRAFTKLDDYYKKLDPNATPTERQRKLSKMMLATAKAKDTLYKEATMKKLLKDVDKATKEYGREAAADLLLNPIAKADARAARELAQYQMMQQVSYNQQMMQMQMMGMI